MNISISSNSQYWTVWLKFILNHLSKSCLDDQALFSRCYSERQNSIETCILSRVKQITSPGGIRETSARAGRTGKTQRDQVEREVEREVGGGDRDGEYM